MRRGEIRWYRFAAPDKQRPVLLLTRDSVLPHLHEVLAVPISRTVRGLASEVALGSADGMPQPCALNLDHVSLVSRARVGALITALRPERWPEVELALRFATGFAQA